ncbi:hypothetical protein C900_00407 [Fulvivirga imtechensis AK7]|uniref:Uncharacterized protein n=1 Tax=Fulvivirga imtechensis AK7 TaxID=1237149 RepID=L8JHT1_9BACT|nr:hypothetical protein C900_00407 [Fulvivirga imtechensis AK7]
MLLIGLALFQGINKQKIHLIKQIESLCSSFHIFKSYNQNKII